MRRFQCGKHDSDQPLIREVTEPVALIESERSESSASSKSHHPTEKQPESNSDKDNSTTIRSEQILHSTENRCETLEKEEVSDSDHSSAPSKYNQHNINLPQQQRTELLSAPTSSLSSLSKTADSCSLHSEQEEKGEGEIMHPMHKRRFVPTIPGATKISSTHVPLRKRPHRLENNDTIADSTAAPTNLNLAEVSSTESSLSPLVFGINAEMVEGSAISIDSRTSHHYVVGISSDDKHKIQGDDNAVVPKQISALPTVPMEPLMLEETAKDMGCSSEGKRSCCSPSPSHLKSDAALSTASDGQQASCCGTNFTGIGVVFPGTAGGKSVADTTPKSNNKRKRSKAEASKLIQEGGHSSSEFSHLPEGDRNLVKKGTRIAVYWSGDKKYFLGTVKKDRPFKKKRFFVQYDDGDDEWLSLNKVHFYIISGARRVFTHEDWVNDDNWVLGALEENSCSDSDSNSDGSSKLRKPGTTSHKKRKKKQRSTGRSSENSLEQNDLSSQAPVDQSDETIPSYLLDLVDVHIPISEKVKLGRRRKRAEETEESPTKRPDVDRPKTDGDGRKQAKINMSLKKKRRSSDETETKAGAVKSCSFPNPKKRRSKAAGSESPPSISASNSSDFILSTSETSSADMVNSTERIRKEEARTLTPAEVAAILGEDSLCTDASNWVRRSARMPSRDALSAPNTQVLLQKLVTNDTDMVVLKMKKYIPDSATPCVVLDAVLDALEENTNCEALYIQNYNEGMRDQQVLHLLSILQRPCCKIWCLNIGENYKVKRKTWKKFARGLKDTNITHMYTSEHTISSELKDLFRTTIRNNRSKHNMHNDPQNLETIVKCTHCWWNPINAKVLRPYLHAQGYAHMLNDKEVQGLRGSKSASQELI